MATSSFDDLKRSLAQTLFQAARAGAASVLAPLWRDAVGEGLAAHSQPVRLADGVLTVEAEPEFAAELAHASETVRARLNARLGGQALLRVEVVRRA